jgi:hypothetical protein
VKLCVGVDSVDHLRLYHTQNPSVRRDHGRYHITRMWPKRADEILSGGSLYWVIKGQIQCRQRITKLEEVTGSDGIRRCRIVLDPEIVLTQTAPRRAFQGWRYLAPHDAPSDLTQSRGSDDDLPDEISVELAAIGVI